VTAIPWCASRPMQWLRFTATMPPAAANHKSRDLLNSVWRGAGLVGAALPGVRAGWSNCKRKNATVAGATRAPEGGDWLARSPAVESLRFLIRNLAFPSCAQMLHHDL